MSEDINNKNRPIFTMDCVVNNFDLSSNLQRVRIVSSVASFYPVFLLEFLVEGETIIKEDIFGKDDIELLITQTSEDNSPGFQMDLRLVYAHSQQMLLKNRPQLTLDEEAGQARPDIIMVVCLLKDALKDMSTMVNKCFQEDFQDTPYQAIVNVRDKFLPSLGGSLGLSNFDINETVLPKTFNVPRMAFSNFIRYMDQDELGGIYNSPAVAFRGINSFNLFSMRAWQKVQYPHFKIHLLPSSFVSEEQDEIFERTKDNEEEFYTRVPIVTKFSGQTDVISSGGQTVTTVLPTDSLYTRLTTNITDVMKDNAPRDADPTFQHIHQTIKDIEKYSFTPGHESNDKFIRLRMANFIRNTSEIVIRLSRNVIISRLMEPGKAMELKTYSQDYIPYAGLYVVLATDIGFTREESEVYNCNVKIRAARSNIKK